MPSPDIKSAPENIKNNDFKTIFRFSNWTGTKYVCDQGKNNCVKTLLKSHINYYTSAILQAVSDWIQQPVLQPRS